MFFPERISTLVFALWNKFACWCFITGLWMVLAWWLCGSGARLKSSPDIWLKNLWRWRRRSSRRWRENSQAAGRWCWWGALWDSAAGRAVCSGRGCCTSASERKAVSIHTQLFSRDCWELCRKRESWCCCCSLVLSLTLQLFWRRLPQARAEQRRGAVDRLI